MTSNGNVRSRAQQPVPATGHDCLFHGPPWSKTVAARKGQHAGGAPGLVMMVAIRSGQAVLRLCWLIRLRAGLVPGHVQHRGEV